MADSTTWNDELLLRFDADSGDRAVVVESDGRVAYAYLLRDDKPVADVWLCNVVDTPTTVDWKDRDQMPFLNPSPYCIPGAALDLRGRLECRWEGETVALLLEGELFAKLRPGAKPGWSRLAQKDGPLAKTLDSAS